MTKRNLIWATVLILVALAAVFLARQPAPQPSVQNRSLLQPVDQAYKLVAEAEYSPRDEETLIRGAVGGLAGAADEYSTYIPPNKVESFRRRIDGNDCGVGLRLELSAGLLKVLEVRFGSSAQLAGLEGGATILSIDGRQADDISVAEAEHLLDDGPPGSTVRVELAGPDGAGRDMALERRLSKVESVAGLYRDQRGRWQYLVNRRPAIALVRVREFVRDTAGDVQVALRQLDSLDGLVLDLRDNPGGQLPSAAAVADLFLSSGTIFTIVDRSGSRQVYAARSEGTYSQDLSIVVLVNAKTSSAAEIVAGALSLSGRAVVVGGRTRGKGLVQSTLPLPSGMGEVNLTTAEFLLGEGQSITRRGDSQTWGITPHVQLELPLPQRVRLRRLWSQMELPVVGDAEPLTRPATRPSRSRPSASSAASSRGASPDLLLQMDQQLAKAIELLANPEEYRAILMPDVAKAPPEEQPAR